jgi:two-component system sensor histidine kinase KdpD
MPDERLPLLEFDAVLIERVFCNLLENAAKYSPADPDRAAACKSAAFVESVLDRGPGFPGAPPRRTVRHVRPRPQ